MSAPIRDCGMDSCAIVLLRVVCSPTYAWRVFFPSYAFFGGCAPGHVIWARKSVDSQVETHFCNSCWVRMRRLKRLCYTSIQASPIWASPCTVASARRAACRERGGLRCIRRLRRGTFGGALSGRISGDTKNPRFRRTGDRWCARRDSNPQPSDP